MPSTIRFEKNFSIFLNADRKTRSPTLLTSEIFATYTSMWTKRDRVEILTMVPKGIQSQKTDKYTDFLGIHLVSRIDSSICEDFGNVCDSFLGMAPQQGVVPKRHKPTNTGRKWAFSATMRSECAVWV